MISLMEGTPELIVRMLYGSGLRIMEAVRLRVKDVEACGTIWVSQLSVTLKAYWFISDRSCFKVRSLRPRRQLIYRSAQVRVIAWPRSRSALALLRGLERQLEIPVKSCLSQTLA